MSDTKPVKTATFVKVRLGRKRGGDDVDLEFLAGGNLKSGPSNFGTCATFAEMTFEFQAKRSDKWGLAVPLRPTNDIASICLP